MQQIPRLTLAEFIVILERYECRWSTLIEEWEGTVYAIERGEGNDLKVATIHIWEPEAPIPLDVIRSVCTALGLGPDIFGIIN